MSIEHSLFRHVYPMRVRSFHVDRQNVVHNIWYFYFLEEARVEYMREIGMPIDAGTFVSHNKFFVVRNTCDYHAAAVYDDEIIVKTRIEYVKNSSMGFDHVLVEKQTGKKLVTATHVLVHVDVETGAPSPIPDELRDTIKAYEGENVRFVEKT